MAHCHHEKSAPDEVIESLPHSQAGTGRHKCAVCAYNEGLQAGRAGISLATHELEECKHGSEVPVSTLTDLPNSQATPARHLCPNCAYQQGYKAGNLTRIP